LPFPFNPFNPFFPAFPFVSASPSGSCRSAASAARFKALTSGDTEKNGLNGKKRIKPVRGGRLVARGE
jgi:hypothetical protein